MTNHSDNQITTSTKAADSCENEAGSPMPELIGVTQDESAHSSDGLLLHGWWDGPKPVTAFKSRVTDNWVKPQTSLKAISMHASAPAMLYASQQDLCETHLNAGQAALHLDEP